MSSCFCCTQHLQEGRQTWRGTLRVRPSVAPLLRTSSHVSRASPSSAQSAKQQATQLQHTRSSESAAKEMLGSPQGSSGLGPQASLDNWHQSLLPGNTATDQREGPKGAWVWVWVRV